VADTTPEVNAITTTKAAPRGAESCPVPVEDGRMCGRPRPRCWLTSDCGLENNIYISMV
jgi:hypothetical protein